MFALFKRLLPAGLAAVLAVSLAGCVREGPRDASALVDGGGVLPDTRSALATDSGSKALSSAMSDGADCVTVNDSATTVGEGRTRRIAETGLASTLEKRRGELIASGLRRVSVSPTKTNCTPYLQLGAGMQEFICQSSAQICGISAATLASAKSPGKALR